MVKLKAFLSRHLLLLGILAVVTSLLIILFLQYRSLVTLEATLPVYRKEMMKKYLGEIAKEVESFYEASAEQALSVPATTIINREDGVIPIRFNSNSCGNCQVLAAVEHVADHFKQQSLKGVKRYFVVVMTVEDQRLFARIAFVYNPANQKMESAGQAIDPKGAASEFNAIHSASAPLMPNIRTGKPIIPKVTGYDGDSEHRIIVRPIVDEMQRMIGIAGMVINQAVFKEEYLPSLIQRTLPKYLPEEYRNAAMTMVDEQNRDVFSTQSGLKPEVQIPFTLIYTDWRLGISMQQMTEEQWARRNFIVNVSLWAVMTSLLVGGVVLALRAASREMKVSQMKTDFVSNVSHELRTPLASIRVFGEFLKLGRVRDTDKVREYGAYIETESRRLTQLINNILDFSRIESGQKSYHFEPADVGEIVAETFKTFEVLLKQSDFQITFEAPSSPLPQVLADPDAIMQAFVNLLDNAVKYSGPEREIGVRLGRKNNWVTISVSDRGIGIPAEDQEKIFERFHRVSTGLVHDVKGTGLGLSIVKHIVEAHHGKITVESAPGRGSTFTIYLPAEESFQIKPESQPTPLVADGNSAAGAGT